MDGSKGMARDHDARASSAVGKGAGEGDAARSDAGKVAISVFGSALTVAVALAALILTSAHYTREQFQDQNELMRRHFAEQLDLMRGHSDSQFEQMRADLREVRDDVRALTERQAKVEGLLLAVRRTEAVAPSPAGGADSSPSRPEDPASQ